MKKLLACMLTVVLGTNLVACASMSNQDTGTVAGAIAGGLLGSQFGKGGGQMLAIGAGALAGAYFGGKIGQSMDELDRMKMNQALDNNPTGQPAYWVNEHHHATYTVVPMRSVTFEGNPYCREFRTTADIGGKKQQMYGTACRQPDGSWKMVSGE